MSNKLSNGGQKFSDVLKFYLQKWEAKNLPKHEGNEMGIKTTEKGDAVQMKQKV